MASKKPKAKAAAAATSEVPPESVEVSRRSWDRWRTARDMIKQWEDVRDKARKALEAEIGDSPVATVNGVPVIGWKETEKRNVFDAAAHAKEQPECHASYTVKKPGTRPFNELEFDPEQVDPENEE